MTLDAESLYSMLGQLIRDTPEFGRGPLPSEHNAWLGRACVLVEAGGNIADTARINLAATSMSSMGRSVAAQEIAIILHRTLARAELNAPVTAQGAFIPAGNAFDALAALSKVLRLASTDLLIVDPYMDEKTLTDYVGLANVGVTIRLLADAAHVKPSLLPAAAAWLAQHGATRPLEVKVAAPKTLHDRLVIVDGQTAYTLTQSLNAFAKRAPASVVRVDQETSFIKVGAYAGIWANATPL